MIKESRLMVRLIALWIVFIASLGLFFWFAQALTMSVAKMANGGYETQSAIDKGTDYMGYGPGSSYISCILPPAYPQTSYPPMPETKIDQAAMAKYNQDMEKYNNDYAIACKADVEKQQLSQSKQEKSASNIDITTYTILSLLSIIFAILSFRVIKKTEEA